MNRLFSRLAVLTAAIGAGLWSAGAIAQPAQTLLIRQPAISANHLAFVYAGDIWLADRNGKNPQRITTHPADELAPVFSPDGKSIAFTARYDGNTDVYVVGIDGGQPKRLTWHPGPDTVAGWSVDGKRVLFASPREVALGRSNQLYEVAVEGGFEKKVMEAQAFEGRWSADGKRLAYRPYRLAYSNNAGWRLNRGGSAPPIWIIDPVANTWERVPHTNSNDMNPLWAGNDVVFISDRDNVASNLFIYRAADKSVKQLTQEKVWDVRNATLHGDIVVYEVGGRLKELNLKTNAIRDLLIQVNVQAIQARPQWKDATGNTTSARLSATGKRVVVTARGEVFTVPTKDGSVRNITQTSGVREKDGMWSPDGQSVAYISDAGLKHSVVIRDQLGLNQGRTINLGVDNKGGYLALQAWSPDGKTIVYSDNLLNLYALDVASGASRIIDNRQRRGGWNVSFSSDSRYLAYAVAGDNYMQRIRIHDFTSGKSTTVTDGLSHADNPVFGGTDYLYFTASINTGPAIVGLDMSSQERPIRDGIYALVLAADGKSPMAARTGDEDEKKEAPKEPPKDAGKDAGKDAKPATPAAPAAPKVKPTKIDFHGLMNRVVALPVAERNYDSLAVGSDGGLFYIERRQPGASNDAPDPEGGFGPQAGELVRFNFEERKQATIKSGVVGISMSADGKKMLIQLPRGRLEIADANAKLDAKPIDTAQVGAVIDPREEWQQIFNEAWWMQKEFFYDGNMHGLDWNAVRARYAPLVKHVQRREDLNELIREMIAELQVGHNNVGGGDLHRERPANTGLLGADFSIENNLYRIKTIYQGDRWNPFLRAPLAVPGLGVAEGDYIVSINGRAITAKDNLYSFLENTVGRQVTLGVTREPGVGKVNNVVVQPVASESALRQWSWVEKNRQAVDKASNGRIAYVYLPDTAGDGYKHFNRMFFAQVEKDGVIVDDRRNSGGQAANYVTDVLSRTHLAGWKDRAGMIFETPAGAIYGPKAMLIDQDAGSGGDFLPYAFKRMGLGPLIGKRTWGGLIGISANPQFVDGGNMTVPFFRFFTPEKEWRIENEGVAPDIDVELDPTAVNRGRDLQLEAAIKNVMDRLGSAKTTVERKRPPAPATLGK
ncbi:MAG: PDZ domain-containing protein [Nitrosomonadaceae bacterium]|nr:PDZ domain-containing protein [Nitrosomonadaceae bacterium]